MFFLTKGLHEKIKHEPKEQKGKFLSMFIGTLGASLLENMLAGKVVRRGDGIIRAEKGVIRPNLLCRVILSTIFK